MKTAAAALLAWGLLLQAIPVPAWDLAVLDTARSADWLSTAEKDLVLEINKLRTDPRRYAEEVLAPRRADYSGRLYKRPGQVDTMTIEGAAALEECIAELAKTGPVSPLRPSRGLSRAAADHAADQGRSGATGHTGSDGSAMDTRIGRYGAWERRAGENISYGRAEAVEILVQLVVDDGVASRGHRRNLLEPAFGVVGLAIGRHARYGSICVMDFAGGYVEGSR